MPDAPRSTAVPADTVVTVARWMGPSDRPLLSWVTTPLHGSGSVGVVVAPPIGYELWSSHRTLRTLAERLAAQGSTVLRFDYDGTGDSAGDQWDPARLDTWRRDLGTAAASLRELGVSSLVLVGLRIGATLSLLEGPAVGADAVVAWAPVVRGRRYVRELQLLGVAVPDDPGRPERSGAIVEAGSVFSRETLRDLGAIDLTALPAAPAPRTLVVDRDDAPPSTPLLDRLATLGTAGDHEVCAGTEGFLDRPTEYAVVPEAIVERICSWVGGGTTVGPVPEARTKASFSWRGTVLTEEAVRLDHGGLVGVDSRPPGSGRATVVWLNSGSEHHVGPGRAWVEYARDLATAGYRSLRVDFSGWGESPDRGHAPGRPYDAHALDEVHEIVDELHRSGRRPVVVAGLCAGAWLALRAAVSGGPDGVIAINPQLYWQPGDPVEADIIGETRARRQSEIQRIKRLRRTGLWWGLDLVGSRHPASTWLRALDRSGTSVLTLFAAGDDGLEFLEDRTARSWARARRRETVDLVVIPEIDHPMHRHWRRSEVVTALVTWLDRRVGGG
jgi:alpha-beta hydrolase superfamily lysophospholipase